MKYELTLPGFNGGTSNTDDHVIWVSTPMHPGGLLRFLFEHSLWDIKGCDPLPDDFSADIDFTLPDEVAELKAYTLKILKEN